MVSYARDIKIRELGKVGNEFSNQLLVATNPRVSMMNSSKVEIKIKVKTGCI